MSGRIIFTDIFKLNFLRILGSLPNKYIKNDFEVSPSSTVRVKLLY